MRLNKYFIYTTALFLNKPSSCHRDLWAEAGGHGKSNLIENFESIFGDEPNFEHGFGKHGGDKDSKLKEKSFWDKHVTMALPEHTGIDTFAEYDDDLFGLYNDDETWF